MSSPASTQYSRVDKGGFLLEWADESATIVGAPGTYSQVICISGTPSFTDNFDVTEDQGNANHCELQDASSGDYKDGTLNKRNGGVSYLLDMLLGTAVQNAIRTAYENKKEGFLKVTFKDIDNATTKVLYDVKVKTPSHTPVPNDTGRSQWNIEHRFVMAKPVAGWPTV